MTDADAVNAVLDAIRSVGLPHMVVGSLSSNAYGIPRSTQDADIVIDPGSRGLLDLAGRLPAGLHMDPQLSFETVTGTNRVIISVTESVFTIEIFILRDDAYDRQRFARRRPESVQGRETWLPSPEDVIITKLRWSKQGKRSKDVDDVRNVIAVQGDGLDWAYIHRWCDEHGTRGLLEQIRASIPPGL